MCSHLTSLRLHVACYIARLALVVSLAPHLVPLQRIDVPLPPWKRISVDGRVMELIHGSHLDDVLQDAPDEVRPPTMIFFHDSSGKPSPETSHLCSLDDYLKLANQEPFGGREQLLMAHHDVGLAPKRVWFHMSPERNLSHRFLRPLTVEQLPVVVILPRTCNGWTKWCDPGGAERVVGGACYVEQCTGFQPLTPDKLGTWVHQAKDLLKAQEKNNSVPTLYETFSSMLEQQQWLRSRDTATTKEHIGLLQQPRSLPRFTKKGYKIMKIPDELNKVFLDVYRKNRANSYQEEWHTWGQTQINAHAAQPRMVSFGNIDETVDKIMKPRLEKWVGLELEKTSMYGFREYRHPSMLRGHLDRLEVLVVSVTFSVYQEGFNHSDWPLEVIDFDGNTVRAEHPMGTMMYYESATLLHGKPSKLPPGGLHVGLFLHYRPTFWETQGYANFSDGRCAKSLAIITDDRPRHQHQEGWPREYYQRDDADTDLEEGTYKDVLNVCGDAKDQRDDGVRLGYELLDACKRQGAEAKVAGLLDRGADANFADEHGWRALHEAARAGSLPVIRLLLEANADPNAKTKHGNKTFVNLADEGNSFAGNREALQVLLESRLEL